jgi:hypothetical protein
MFIAFFRRKEQGKEVGHANVDSKLCMKVRKKFQHTWECGTNLVYIS